MFFKCDTLMTILARLFEQGYAASLQFTAWYIILGCWYLLLESITIMLLAQTKSVIRALFVYDLLKSQWMSIVDTLWLFIGANRRRKVLPFFFFTFFAIGAMNIFGMLPYSRSITSQSVVTICLAFVVWYNIVVEGLNLFGVAFFGPICPMTLPRPSIPLLILIELISYVSRMVSLALRLFANIVAGHVLSESSGFAGYYVVYGGAGFMYHSVIIVIMMCFFLSILILSESLVSVPQAYIFTILCMIYMRDVYFLQGILE